MKQAVIYSTKVWLTAIGIAYGVLMVALIYPYFTQVHSEHHGVNEGGPIFGTVVFIVLSVFMLPAFLTFCYLVKPVIKTASTLKLQKLRLNLLGAALILLTFSPMLITHASDATYYPLAGCYILFISISVWIYRPIQVSNELPIATDKE